MTRNFRRVYTVLALAVFLLAINFGVSSQTTTSGQSARFRVYVPQADAKVFFAGALTKQQGTERIFESQLLKDGIKYRCEVKTVWEPNNYTRITRTKIVNVEPGGSYVVDLRLADAKSPDEIVVRYVPTPTEVVHEMLKIGKVGKGDVVFDLGCGDGRFLIDAIRLFGAKRGVGVDIDPDRIRDSNANALKYGLQDKVKFREGDVLQKVDDLADASVVMLYMGEDINLRLRPRLKKMLKPGTRVVSHRFLMGDWKPEKSITVKDKQGTPYDIHLWTIGKKTK